MSANSEYQMSTEQRELLTSLQLSDEATQGRPQLPPETEEFARDYLSLVLVDVRAEMAHVKLLQEFYQAKFSYPLSRCFWQGEPRPSFELAAGFRHNQFLPEQRARDVAEHGPGVLSSDELAVLFLNPYALWDLADLIGYLMPEYWLDRLGQVGQELIDRLGLHIPIPGLDETPAA